MIFILFSISFVLLILFIIGIFKPTSVVKFGKANRKNATLQYFIPSLIFIIASGVVALQENEEQWEHPDGTITLHLSYKKFTNLPEKLKEFKDLERLHLGHGKLTSLDKDILTAMPKLKRLNLSFNPIAEIPLWVGNLGLDELILDGTKISVLPKELTDKIYTISYKDTPYEKSLEPVEVAVKETDEDPHGETLGEYAVRNLLGRDYGYKKKFKKGELYYTKSVPEKKVDALGEYLIEQSFFNDETRISMQITFNDKKDINAYELRGIYSGGHLKPSEETAAAFALQALFISNKVFDGKPVHFHLTDKEFETKFVYKSNDLMNGE